MPSNIKDEFATIDLGDQRLDERLLRCAGRLAQDPCASLRAACKGEAEVKAGYRLLHNEKVDMEQILAAHRQAGLKRIGGCAQEEAILFIQDTTELDFTNHKALSGSGPLADLSLRGFYLHNHLLVSELGGVVLALCSAKAWARKDEDHGKSKERRHLPMEQKESIRWLEGYEEACKLAGELPPGKSSWSPIASATSSHSTADGRNIVRPKSLARISSSAPCMTASSPRAGFSLKPLKARQCWAPTKWKSIRSDRGSR